MVNIDDYFLEKDEEIIEKQPFIIDNYEKAEWMVEKLNDYDNQIEAEERKLKLLQAQIERRKKRIENKKNFFTFRYSSMLKEWARNELEGKKERSIIFPFGTLSFRKSELGWKVKSLSEASKFAKEHKLDVYSEKTVNSFDIEKYKQFADEQYFKNNFIAPGLWYNNSEETFTINTTLKEEEDG